MKLPILDKFTLPMPKGKFIATRFFFSLVVIIVSILLTTNTLFFPQSEVHAATHVPARYVSLFTPSFSTRCSGWGWSHTIDPKGFDVEYIRTNGTTNCADADWYLSGRPTTVECYYELFVPSADANATSVVAGLWDVYGTKFYSSKVNEQPYSDAWVGLGYFHFINHINIGNNDGETTTWLGLGSTQSLRVTC